MLLKKDLWNLTSGVARKCMDNGIALQEQGNIDKCRYCVYEVEKYKGYLAQKMYLINKKMTI